MRKMIHHLLCLLTISAMSHPALAILSMELTRGVQGAIPIAVAPFAAPVVMPQDVSRIIASDLQNSGRFKVYGGDIVSEAPSDVRGVAADYFRRLGTDNVVIGRIEQLSGDRYQVSFQLLDMLRGPGEKSVVLSKKLYSISA